MPQHLFSLKEILAMLEVSGLGEGARHRFQQQAEAVAARRPKLGEGRVLVSSSYGFESKRGFVALQMGEAEEQMPPGKAIEIANNLHAAAAAAIGDEGIMRLLDDLDVEDTPEHRGAILLRLRELRQGSRDTVYPQ